MGVKINNYITAQKCIPEHRNKSPSYDPVLQIKQ